MLTASLSAVPLLSVKGSKDNGKGRFGLLKNIKTRQPLIAGVMSFMGGLQERAAVSLLFLEVLHDANHSRPILTQFSNRNIFS